MRAATIERSLLTLNEHKQRSAPLGVVPSGAGLFLSPLVPRSLSLESVVAPIRQHARLFRRAQPHDAINRIWCTLLRRVEMPHL
jgi:hypothetical protein